MQTWNPEDDPAIRPTDERVAARAGLDLDEIVTLRKLRDAVLAAERTVVDTGSHEIVHVDRAAWDRVVVLAKGRA